MSSDQIPVLKDMLLNVGPNQYTMYDQIRSAQARQIQQQGAVSKEVTALRNQIESIRKTEETYDREYLDRRSAGQGTVSKGQMLGFKTSQDLVLAFFFGAYALLSLVVVLYAVIYSEAKGKNALLAVAAMTFIGLIINQMIRMLA